MLAQRLHAAPGRLVCESVPDPHPGPGQVLLRVRTCAVCRTDLHLLDGELPDPVLPISPGHEIVGLVTECGPGVSGLAPGDRVGVPWLGWTCGVCDWCCSGRENLCPSARFTGCHLPGGYAEQVVADARFCFPIPAGYDDVHAAPLLCAGLIGYRALRFTGDAMRVGLYGFGAAAHIVAQVLRAQGREVFAFARAGDTASQDFARSVGASWAGSSDEAPPSPLQAAIIFAPVGALVPTALRAVDQGGRVVCAGIHMSDIPGFAYRDLWRERSIMSVANLTRRDGAEFMALAGTTHIETHVRTHPLTEAQAALDALRRWETIGAEVLVNG